MLFSVKLNNKLGGMAIKIGNILTNYFLPLKSNGILG